MTEVPMDRTLQSLKEAISIVRSNPRRRKQWPRLTGSQIKEIRERLELSQAEFARRFGLDLASVRHWERDRREPEQGNCLILRMVECDPAVVAKLVHRVRTKVGEDELEQA